MNAVIEQYDSPPHAGRFMLSACLPSRGWKALRRFPELEIHWHNFSPSLSELQAFLQRCHGGLPLDNNRLALLAPSIAGFRTIMVMLAHRAWPLPIWKALQIRNRLTLYRPVADGERFDLMVGVDGWRALEKGLEVDLRSRLMQGDECVWEGMVTFYYRGQFGKDSKPGVASSAPADFPDLSGTTPLHAWRTSGAHRWDFGAWTGDYNGIHLWDRYARLLGFDKAFAHPQRLVSQCLTLWPPSSLSLPLQLDLWIRGPVSYENNVTLHGQHYGLADVFALHIAGDSRPALVGRLASPQRQH